MKQRDTELEDFEEPEKGPRHENDKFKTVQREVIAARAF